MTTTNNPADLKMSDIHPIIIMKKIAFCFLIRSTIYHEDLWRIYLSNVDPNKYTVYIHYKENTPLKHFEKNKVQECVPTQYADLSLVIAQNRLLSSALMDEKNQHFIFLSDSCIPLKSFDYLYDTLNVEYSYFNISPHAACFPRCDSLLGLMDREKIQKASQWCIVNRKHATVLLQDKCYLPIYRNVYAPDEICYITTLYLRGLENELITTPNVATATTFINWKGMDYPYPPEGNIKTYDTISEEELQYLLKSPSFFGRKFTKECMLYYSWYILHILSKT